MSAACARLLLVALTFVLIVVLAQLALVAARTRFGHAPLWDVLAQAWEGTGDYFANLLTGSLGEATTTTLIGAQRRAVGELLAEAYPRSIGLVAIAVGAAAALGVVAGIAGAAARGARAKGALLAATVVALSAPSFLVALVLLVYGAELYARTGIRLWPSFGFGWDDHLIVPAIALGARPFAQIANVTLVAVEQTLARDYVRTARAKGLGERAVLLRHALRNAVVPILSAAAIGISLGISSLPVVETLFNWRGLGFYLLLALQRFDAATAGTLLGALAVTLAVSRMALDGFARRFAARGAV